MSIDRQFERTVEANAATPCPGNVSVLLQCAIACVYKGDDAAARRLEARAYAIGMQGFRDRIEPPRLRLALVRNDLAEVRRLVDSMAPVASTAWGFGGAPALLDALIALRDYARIESDAPAWLRPGTYAEPFAIRALAVARNDERLLREAAARFAAMDLDWHAAETRKSFS